MTKLTDIQTILLSSAAQRSDGSLMPPPDSLTATSDRIGKAIGSLLKRGLAEEGKTNAAAKAWRTEGEQRFAARITDAGRNAIGVEADGGKIESGPPVAPAPAPEVVRRPTKAALVLEMLRRREGATLAELVAATGWLPHTTRAALTGLRKKGHQIDKAKRGEETVYRIVKVA